MNWRQGFLLAAETIEAREIIDNEEIKPPHWLTKLETAIWRAKHRVLLHYLISTLPPAVAQSLEGINRQSLLTVWRHLQATYGISRAQERLNVIRSFKNLTLEGNDYHNYLTKYRKIVTQMENLGITIQDILHDNFIAGLGDYNKVFVDSQLDIFYANSRNNPGRITNLNLSHLQEALLNRASECEKVKRKETKVNVASYSSRNSNHRNWNTNSTNGGRRNSYDRPRSRDGSQNGKSAKRRCSYCGGFNHTDDICLYRYPERATDEFRKINESKIKYLKEQHIGDSGGSDSESQRIIQMQPAFMAQASSAVALQSIQSIRHANLRTSWHLDTCASFHMCNDRNFFTTYKPHNGDKIRVANNTFAQPTGIGKVIMQIDDGVLELDDVRHVPSLGSNLVSYGQLDDQGFGLAVSETSPRFHIITTPQGDTFHTYKTAVSNVYQIGECTQIGHRQKSTAYSATTTPDISAPAFVKQFGSLHTNTGPTSTTKPGIRNTPGSSPIRGEASTKNKMAKTSPSSTTGQDRWRPIWSFQGPTGNRLPKRKDNREFFRNR